MEWAPETATAAGQAGQRIGDDWQAQSVSRPRGVFEVDEDAALAELGRDDRICPVRPREPAPRRDRDLPGVRDDRPVP